jgi:hypothetical protein
MIDHERYDDMPGKKKLSTEDSLWIVSGVVVSFTLLAIIYFGLTLYTAF